ncbi:MULTISPECIES: hypothetical protein [Vibrio]|uniref:hypothetical protein n=1 Tax=Vibrio TaxID=662 RepID=UPI00148205C2|nr:MULTISPECIES: hypothetical protein [Vibrio]MDQ2164982.1 hypothetical protein [Vibrio anguillarum]MDQ2189849.1 hypothetical protein [Vibrio sp. A14(2019)]MDQ2198026.1 hypothetical protein [Vibrio sp. 2017_1457_11]NNN77091.1 hypothetical protein [Vibrio sp. B7]NNN93925.1 hypothetical protein [Vibrio sp. B8-1]
MNFKKAAIIAAFAISSNAMANPSVTAIWAGVVPGSSTGDVIKITGLNGSAVEQGELYVNADGTFASSQVRLEARKIDTNELHAAQWTVTNTTVAYSTSGATGANLDIYLDGTSWIDGPVNAASFDLTLVQTKALDVVPGEAVNAQVTLVASAVL